MLLLRHYAIDKLSITQTTSFVLVGLLARSIFFSLFLSWFLHIYILWTDYQFLWAKWIVACFESESSGHASSSEQVEDNNYEQSEHSGKKVQKLNHRLWRNHFPKIFWEMWLHIQKNFWIQRMKQTSTWKNHLFVAGNLQSFPIIHFCRKVPLHQRLSLLALLCRCKKHPWKRSPEDKFIWSQKLPRKVGAFERRVALCIFRLSDVEQHFELLVTPDQFFKKLWALKRLAKSKDAYVLTTTTIRFVFAKCPKAWYNVGKTITIGERRNLPNVLTLTVIIRYKWLSNSLIENFV